ncbi:MAG: bacteriophage N4 adsorption protein A, partial [Ramlibacter sp.]
QALPLTGPPYVLATDAYKAYARGDYAQAIAKATEALRQRPDATQLKTLISKSRLAQAAPRRRLAGRAATVPPVAAATVPVETVKAAALPVVTPVPPAPVPPQPARDPAYEIATAAYSAFDAKDYAQAAAGAREAVRLSPANRGYRLLLMNALLQTGGYVEADETATVALAAAPADAALLAQRGAIRKRLGQDGRARADFDAALRAGGVPVMTEVGLLADLGRKAEARARFDTALDSGALAQSPQVEVAYLAARVGEDDRALAAFQRADAAGKLPNTAYLDAAFTATRGGEDAQAVGYFKRGIDDAGALKLKMEPQLLFQTRRAVAEVSRAGGVIASLTYRGAVAGLGLAPGAGADSLQGGVEAYWRPWGYRNGRYAEVFARAFQTLSSQGGASGPDTRQAAVGIRYRPLADANVVASFSRVISPAGGRNDWLAQLAYSGGAGTDLRVDAPAWWTTRISAEAGRYLSAGQTYALAEAQAGRSMRAGADGDGGWVLFPHVSLAADYDSTALESSAVGIGPGVTARYWFRADAYNAPRSYLDLTLQYRVRISGAQRARGVFVNSTVSY